MRSNRFVKYLVPVPLLILPFFTSVFFKPLYLYPGKKSTSEFTINTRGDSDIYNEGQSYAKIISGKNEPLYFEFVLQQGYLYPFAGARLEFDKNLIDFGRFDSMKLKLKAPASRTLRLKLTKDLDIAPAGYCVYEMELPVDNSGDGEYNFSLEKFAIPDWWYSENKFSKYDFRDDGLIQIKALDLYNGTMNEIPFRDRVRVTELSLHRDPLFLGSIAGALASIYYLFLLTLYLIKKYKKEPLVKKIVIPYNELTLKDRLSEEDEKVIKYIGDNYSNFDLNVEKVSQGTGVSSLKIPAIIKRNYNLTFPQYLNSIRLAEAKRLLKKTRMPVVEVAENVGYNTVTYFNRVFKKIENCSPLEYRKKESQDVKQ